MIGLFNESKAMLGYNAGPRTLAVDQYKIVYKVGNQHGKAHCNLMPLSRSPIQEDSEETELSRPWHNEAVEAYRYPLRARRPPGYLKDYIEVITK